MIFSLALNIFALSVGGAAFIIVIWAWYRQRQKLRAVQSTFDRVYENTSVGLVFINKKRDFVMANDAFYKIFGKIFGNEPRRSSFSSQVVEDDFIFFQKWISENTFHRAELSFPKRPERPRPRLSIEAHPFDNDLILLVVQDVSQLRRLEKHRRQFVSNVSHEFKTPLTSIRGYAEFMKENHPPDPGNTIETEYLDVIINNAKRLEETVQNLLILSQIENEESRGEDEMPMTEVHVGQLIRECHSFFDPKSDLSSRVEFQIDDSLQIWGNARLLEQALLNLIQNAAKYSPPQSPIQIIAARLNDKVVVKVTDHGQGIPEKDLNRIFERFYRVDKSRSRLQGGGSGLGLAIVKHIAQLHRGQITAESKVGVGTTFVLSLPIAALPKEPSSLTSLI